ncbi:hypothetical protein [Gemmatimonas sp.]|uniref:hypothetical protein n=1 Tax=Gemmatimonas sp. TaxID=1962908 RepID=UPI00334208AD
MTLSPSSPPPAGIDSVYVPGELTVPRPVFVPPPPPPPPPVVPVPATWLLAQGSPAVQFRLLRDIAGQPSTSPGWPRVPYASRAGWHLMAMQDHDGTWPGGMLTAPGGTTLEGVGTIPAYRRLLELGWDTEAPGMVATKRLLFRLLAEDTDPTLLAELRPEGDDEELVLRGRLQLREAAAAALAQAGFEDDPRLRGAARRLIDRVHTFFKSPLAQKPWIRVGNQHVLPPEVSPPSFHLLVMLSYMPQFRSEHYQFMDQLYSWLTQPWPRQVPMQQMGERLIEQPHFVLGDFLTTRSALDGDMPSALAWLETMARMGILGRHEGWVKLLERTLDDRSRKGVWTPPRSVVMPANVPSWSWPLLPLGDTEWGGNLETTLSADVTFRLCLIAKLAGRTLDLL